MSQQATEQREILVRPTHEGRVQLTVRTPEGEAVYECELAAEDAEWLGRTLVRTARLAEEQAK